MNRRLLVAGTIALMLAVVASSGCEPRGESKSFATVEAAARDGLSAAQKSDGAPDALGDATAALGAAIHYYHHADGQPVEFDTLTPGVIQVPVLVDGEPVWELSVSTAPGGRFVSQGGGEPEPETYRGIQEVAKRYGAAAQTRVVGQHSGIWIAVKLEDRVFGVPVFNAEGARRDLGREYPLDAFAK